MTMKFPHLGKFGWVLVIAVIVGGFQLIDAYRASQSPTADQPVIRSVSTVTPPAEEEKAGVDVAGETTEPNAASGLALFDADIKSEGNGVYWPHMQEEEYKPGLDRGLAILCYQDQTQTAREYTASFPNGMPVGTICPFFRVAAYQYGMDHLVAVSVLRPLPGPGEIP